LPTMSGSEKRTPAVEIVDDPEDPELSELLDSALADFGRPPPGGSTAAAPPAATTAVPAAGAAPPPAAAGLDQDNLSGAYKAFEDAMKQALQEGAGGASADTDSGSMASSVAGLAEQLARADVESADDPLARTLAELSRNLSADAEKVGGEDDMTELLKSFASAEGGGAGGGDGAQSLEAFMPLMQSVMSSILSKDVLYPSLKDVSERYPAWLEANGAALEPAERLRYEQQHRLMVDVCTEFEGPEEGRQERVFVLMQKMQALGQPPKELVGDSDLPEGIPGLPTGASGGDCSVM